MTSDSEPAVLRLLLVEDSEADAELVAAQLQRGYRVAWQRVDTADGVRRALAQTAWDLVISDYDLPQFSALDALALVRASGRDVPFLIVSGRIDQAMAGAAMRAGAHDYFFKGDLERLLPAVERELREADERRARRAAEAALAAREAQYRRLVEASPDPIYIHCDGRVVFVNAGALAFFGADSPAQVLGKTVWDIVHHADHALLGERLAELAAGRALPPQEEHFVRLDGRVVAVEVAAAPTVWQGQTAVQVVFRDITQRKQAEQEIWRLNQDLNRRVDELQTLLEILPVGICVAYDREGRQMTINTAGARMLGIGVDVNPSKTGPAAAALPFRVLQNGREVPDDELPMQVAAREDITLRDAVYQILHADGSEVHLLEYAAPLHDEGGGVRGCVGVFVDITERTQAERTQRVLAEAGRLLAESPDVQTTLRNLARLAVPELGDCCVVYLVQPGGEVQAAASAHTDPAQQELLEAACRAYLPDPADPHSALGTVLDTRRPWLMEEVPGDRLAHAPLSDEARRLIGRLGPRSVLAVPLVARGQALGVVALIFTDSGRRYTLADLALAEQLAARAAIMIDNTRLLAETQALNTELEQRVIERTAQLQASQEQLRQLTASLEAAREEERARIAREVHDELGQQLTGLKMDVAWIHKRLQPDQKALAEKMQAMARLIDTTIQTVRRITTDLRPGLLDDFGLPAVIDWQLQEFRARTGVEAVLESDVDDLPLTPQQTTSLFRIVQEALTNVTRHARARHVRVRLARAGSRLQLSVQDDGRGFDQGQLQALNSVGLTGMRERALLLGGTLEVRSTAGQGTTVEVEVPLPTSEPAGPQPAAQWPGGHRLL